MATIITNYDNKNQPEVGDNVSIINPDGRFGDYKWEICNPYFGRTGQIIYQDKNKTELFAVKFNIVEQYKVFNWQQIFHIDL
jgi:hypothetical protein